MKTTQTINIVQCASVSYGESQRYDIKPVSQLDKHI